MGSQNLHFKATRFRRTCDCAAQLSDYQKMKSLDSYKSVSIQLQRRMSFTLSRLANVLATSEFPYRICWYSSERTKSKRCYRMSSVGQCIFQRGYVLELFFQVINCPVIKTSCKSVISRKHQESYFVCRSYIIYWLQSSKDENNLRAIHARKKKDKTKSIYFSTDLSNVSKVRSRTCQSPSLHTAFLSDWNPWIDTYINSREFCERMRSRKCSRKEFP